MTQEERDRLERLEHKVDQVLAFTNELRGLLGAYVQHGGVGGKLLGALVRVRAGRM